MYEQVMWSALRDELTKIALKEKDSGAVWDFLSKEIPGTPTLIMGRAEKAAEKARAALRASKGGGSVLRWNPNAGMHTASSTGGAAYRQAAMGSARAATRRGDALAAGIGGLTPAVMGAR